MHIDEGAPARPTWRIDGGNISCAGGYLRGMPAVAYWGPELAHDADTDALIDALRRPAVPGALDDPEAMTLIPEAGTGFAGLPGIAAHRNGSDAISQLGCDRVDAHSTGIRFLCSDKRIGLSVEQELALDPDSGVLTLRTTVTNTGDQPLAIDWLASGVLPLPHNHAECLTLAGRWSQEFMQSREAIGASPLCRDNRLGRTSHVSFPGLVAGSAGFGADHGDVTAIHLAWSGNHRVWCGRARDGQPYANLGVLLSPGEMHLAPGEHWQAPALHGARSHRGLNGAAQALHRFVRSQVLDGRLARQPRPVHYNSWEACYFDHSEARTLALIQEATALGAERFVLDDGWFEGRNDDRAGLGNWGVCREKYPNGLEPIFDAARAAGLQCGLWIEPEMANADSDVAREHPDWLLRDGDRAQPLGRHQYALNLCLEPVFEHLLHHIDAVVTRYRLDYLKWDMNRDLAHVTVDGRPGGERVTRAAYALMDAVRERHPRLEIEICASGGARADYGALSRGDRIWTSDNHDPRDRQRIQLGFSLFFPPEVMGAHVGSATSDITGRTQSLAFRIANALVGHLGVEPNRDGLADHDIAALAAATRWYQREREWLHASTTWFVDDTEPGAIVRAQTSADGTRALIVLSLTDTPRHAVLAPIRCQGLNYTLRFRVARLDPLDFSATPVAVLDGASLALAGFQPPMLSPDSAAVFELKALAP